MIDRIFCDQLEYKITATLKLLPDDELKGYWCDGVLPPTVDYSQKYVNDNRQITLAAFVGFDGQDQYSLILFFGKKSLSGYARGLAISDCIPDDTGDGWFEIDRLEKRISIQLL